MENLFIYLYSALQSPSFLFLALCLSAFVKLRYLFAFTPHIWKHQKVITPLFFLLISISSALMSDAAWFVKLGYIAGLPIPYFVTVFFIRVAWAALTLQYFALSLFLNELTRTTFVFSRLYLAGTTLTALISGYFLLIAFFQPFTLATVVERDAARIAMNSIEFFTMRYISPIVIALFALVGFFAALKNVSNRTLPTILRKQAKFFTLFFILPYLLIEGLLATCFSLVNDLYIVVSLSTLMLACALYYCLHNVIKLRFSNQHSRVQGPQSPYVINQFKLVIEQLNNATSMQELIHITQAFFKEAFSIPPHAITLIIKNQYASTATPRDTLNEIIDSFITQYPSLINPEDSNYDIMVKDEIAFNNFYLQTAANSKRIQLLNHLSAEIFLPIFSNKKMVGSICISSYNRMHCLSNSEQDAMVAFASYLGNIINLLYQKDRDALLYREKKLKDVLYSTHQEINQYKETIHTFLRQSKQKAMGIIFYKQGRFSRANEDAKKLIPLDPNIHVGHPLSSALVHVAQHVETFKTQYSYQVKDDNGQLLLLSGVPHLSQSHIIITVSYPDVADIIMKQMHLLYDPNDWDYLLYLSSTKAGAQVNAFIPAMGEIVLNCKIQLLKAALNKKAVLLNCANDDLLCTVRLLHSLSLKEHMHTLALSAPTRASDIAVKLFGSTRNDISTTPLLQLLKEGTLFIQNIHFLDLTTQAYLAEYIARGRYRIFETEQYMNSAARIICSTTHVLSEWVHEGRFSSELYGLLKKQMIVIPTPYTLAAEELDSLLDGFSEQIIQSQAARNLFCLTPKEKQKIIESLPASMHELKERIEHITINKSEQTMLTADLSDRGFDDPLLVHAARLGKQALKDQRIMELLWEKFKSQNKIALFLGVNRSSVNRRFKAFQIHDHSQGVA